MKKSFVTMLMAAALALLAAWGAPSLALAEDDEEAAKLANDMPIPMDNPAAVAAGKERFGERCGYCHGGGGKGAKGPCLICGHFKRGGKSSQIYTNIAAGVQGTQMGAFGTTLTQEEILNIIAYLRAQTPIHLEQLKKAGN